MRLFYAAEISSDTATLDEEESRHCAQVLRMGAGDVLHVTDGRGHLWQGTILSSGKKSVQVALDVLVREEMANPARCILAVAPTKQMERMEWLVEKATEIGLLALYPIITTRTERGKLRTDRLQKIALSAMKQSGRLWLPEIVEPIGFEDFLKHKPEVQGFIGHCIEEQPKVSLLSQISREVPSLVCIGPEGDFTATEIENALSAGFRPVSLGESRLRVETAALYATVISNL